MAWNRPIEGGRVASRPPKTNGHLKGLVAAAIVVAGAGVALWFLSDGGEPRRPAEPAQPKGVRPGPSVAPSGGQTPQNPHPTGLPEGLSPNGAPVEPVKETEKKPGAFAPGMIRLPNGFELRFKLPAEGETRQLLAGGEIWEIDSKGNIENVTPPPIFEKPFEGMISSLFERDGMVLPFALKRFSDEEVRKMCREPTYSYDDDTEEITRKRENVAMLKQGILNFLDSGGTFEEFVDDMVQHSQNAQRAQVEGFQNVLNLLQEGKGQEALQYYKACSREMSEKGYGELTLPKEFKEALEAEEKETKK